MCFYTWIVVNGLTRIHSIVKADLRIVIAKNQFIKKRIIKVFYNIYVLISVKKWLKRKNMIEITHKIIYKKIRLFLCVIIHIIELK